MFLMYHFINEVAMEHVQYVLFKTPSNIESQAIWPTKMEMSLAICFAGAAFLFLLQGFGSKSQINFEGYVGNYSKV